MTREEAIEILKQFKKCLSDVVFDEKGSEAWQMAIKALSQEPCELLLIKSDILLHQDDRKKWMESIKREKESGVIILPPYFEPLLVPNDIEIKMEYEPQESEERIMVVMKMTHFEHIPDTCDDCTYYSCKPHPYKGWSDGCELCGHCMDDDQEDDWIYDGNSRPKNCPLIEVEPQESEDKE